MNFENIEDLKYCKKHKRQVLRLNIIISMIFISLIYLLVCLSLFWILIENNWIIVSFHFLAFIFAILSIGLTIIISKSQDFLLNQQNNFLKKQSNEIKIIKDLVAGIYLDKMDSYSYNYHDSQKFNSDFDDFYE